jgi:hypothetical protein
MRLSPLSFVVALATAFAVFAASVPVEAESKCAPRCNIIKIKQTGPKNTTYK